MIKRLIIAAALMIVTAASACAQALPGIDVFSPGLIRVSEKLARGERVTMTAQMSAEDFYYARSLSLLSAMLEGTTFAYTGEGTALAGSDSLRIERGGEILLALGMVRTENAAQFTVNGRAFALPLDGVQGVLPAIDGLSGTPVFERVPLEKVCRAIESVCAGDVLPGGYIAEDAFSVERTMSDDGERLTKIRISGRVAKPGEEAWAIEGWLRQPGGRAPKDTFEITLRQNDDNVLDLAYSALYKSEITKKNKAGKMTVDTTLTAGGKTAGSRVSNRLTVRLANNWTADGEALREKVSVSATFGRTDHTPGLRMQRLNDMSIRLKGSLNITTQEAGDAVIGTDGGLSLTAVFDDNTFVDVSAEASAAIGGACGEAVLPDGEPEQPEAIAAALSEAAEQMAVKIYPQLGDKTRKQIEEGLAP